MKKDTDSTPGQRTPGEVERDNDALRPRHRGSDADETTAQRTGKREGDMGHGKKRPS